MEREFKDIVKVLREAKRRKFIRDFALTGALALSALSQPRATRDIDILISLEKEKIKSFVEWLKYSKEYKLAKHHAGRPKDRIKNLIEVPAGNTWVDIIVASSEVEEEAISTSLSVSAFTGVKLKVVRPEYLIILKLLAGSDQDYLDSAQLWNESIDKRLVRKMVKELFLQGKLQKMTVIARRLLAR